MSDVIDTNIVELKFDSNEFVNGVNHSIMAVDALKDSLKFDSKLVVKLQLKYDSGH